MGIWDRNGDAEWDSGTTGVTKLEIERMCGGDAHPKEHGIRPQINCVKVAPFE